MIRGLLSLVVAGIIFTTVIRAQAPTPLPAGRETQRKPGVPLEPITAIIEAFRSHIVVAPGNVEFRSNEQSHALQFSLIRAPRFAATVNVGMDETGPVEFWLLTDGPGQRSQPRNGDSK